MVDASVEFIRGSSLELVVLLGAVLLLPGEMATIKVETHAKRNNMEPKRKALADDCTQKTALPKLLILNKFSKGKFMEKFNDSKKLKKKNVVTTLHSDHLCVSQDGHLMITDDLNEH